MCRKAASVPKPFSRDRQSCRFANFHCKAGIPNDRQSAGVLPNLSASGENCRVGRRAWVSRGLTYHDTSAEPPRIDGRASVKFVLDGAEHALPSPLPCLFAVSRFEQVSEKAYAFCLPLFGGQGRPPD